MSFQQESDYFTDLTGALPTQLGSRLKWGLVIAALIALVVAISFLRGVYTDWLWFGSLDFRGVYLKVLVTRIVLFAGGAAIFALACGVALYFAHRASQGPEEAPLPPQVRSMLKRLILWGTIVGVGVLSTIFGVIAAGQWEVFLRYESAATFGVVDPVYNNDVSFYVFVLPLYELVQGWALGAVVVITLATFAIYFINFSFRGVGLQITPGIKLQVSIMGALLMVVIGAGLWLDRWGLLLSDQAVVFGAAYTDLNVRKNALMILTIVAVATGVLILVNAYVRGIRLLVGAVALFIVVALLLGVVWPNATQRLRVRPSEFAREQLYIARNIEFTRQGFGLDGVEEQLYPVDPGLTPEMVSDNLQTIDNIRLWDHNQLLDVYKQIQLIRPYYDFKDADVDRYYVDDRYSQVMLAAREVVPDRLREDAQTWVNRKLRYTHGFGVAMSPVTEFTSEGRPEFFAKDIPEDGVIEVRPLAEDADAELRVANPRIYYGEETTDYVIVKTQTEELDYQAAGEELKSTRYFGSGGIEMSSIIRRAAYAWQFTDINILISPEIESQSRIQYRREIQERIATVAPFLLLDGDPYIVAQDEGLFWIQDAFTVSDKYPYSDPTEQGFNYIRNSVKVVVDAFNGSLTFYIWDPSDPMVRTYQSIFPDLFTGKDEMPESLRSHVRYPQDLFGIQAEKYLTYHMLDPQDFYNLEDIWDIPQEKFGQGEQLLEVEPYYVIMKIPGEDREEFVLLIPYTRNDPPILAGWLAARNDAPNYGELVAFRFPKERQVDSPQQVEAKIDNDPFISQWFTLRCQEGSFCIRGNLLVIPIATEEEFGLLYAEPVYLQAEGIDFPELKQVILATGENVVMAGSVPEAVLTLTGYEQQIPEDTAASTTTESAPSTNFQAGIERINDAIGGLKESIEDLEKALEDLKKLSGGQ